MHIYIRETVQLNELVQENIAPAFITVALLCAYFRFKTILMYNLHYVHNV